jgi:hypothetical protein
VTLIFFLHSLHNSNVMLYCNVHYKLIHWNSFLLWSDCLLDLGPWRLLLEKPVFHFSIVQGQSLRRCKSSFAKLCWEVAHVISEWGYILLLKKVHKNLLLLTAKLSIPDNGTMCPTQKLRYQDSMGWDGLYLNFFLDRLYD